MLLRSIESGKNVEDPAEFLKITFIKGSVLDVSRARELLIHFD